MAIFAVLCNFARPNDIWRPVIKKYYNLHVLFCFLCINFREKCPPFVLLFQKNVLVFLLFRGVLPLDTLIVT